MLIMAGKGTKCRICNKDLSDRFMQETIFHCSKCGTKYEPLCGNHRCPKCGGILINEWENQIRIHGGNVLF